MPEGPAMLLVLSRQPFRPRQRCWRGDTALAPAVGAMLLSGEMPRRCLNQVALQPRESPPSSVG